MYIVKEAAEIAHGALFDNHGQSCCAGSRTFVHAKIYDEFVKEAKRLADSRKVGDPFDENTVQGPQIDQEMFDKVMKLIESGKKQGATLVTGGNRVGNCGYFIQVRFLGFIGQVTWELIIFFYKKNNFLSSQPCLVM